MPNLEQWIETNQPVSNNPNLESTNYWTPLTSRVDELDSHLTTTPNSKGHNVHFTLPTSHRNTDGKTWRQHQKKAKQNRRSTAATQATIRQKVLSGTIPSGVSDTGATSTAGKPGDPFLHQQHSPGKVFHLPTGGTTTSTEKAQLALPLRAPADQVDMVPGLTQTLVSGSKMADFCYAQQS